jgi:hypothetical protein
MKAQPTKLDAHRASIAFDPGERTGVCVGIYEGNKQFRVIESLILTMDQALDDVESLFESYAPQNIIIEAFKLYAHKAQAQTGSTFPSVEVIGYIRAFAARMRMLDRIVIQDASCIHTEGRDALEVLPEHRPKITRPNGMKHAQDAYLHLRYFYISQFNRERVRSKQR